MAAPRRVSHATLPALAVIVLLVGAVVYRGLPEVGQAGNRTVRLQDVLVPLTTLAQKHELQQDISVAAAKHTGANTMVAMLNAHQTDPFTMLGVTWKSGLSPEHVQIEAKWRANGKWSRWTPLHIEPDAAAIGRPGTAPLWVGGKGPADAAAVRVAATAGAKPRDIRLITIDPGSGPQIARSAVSQPAITTRAQWGARAQASCDSPLYGTTKGAVVHHTAGSNSYAQADSAGIVRGIQAYHMDAQDWCDIGYSFLVDKYGQTFEGRAGGIDKQVRGAHSGNADVNLDMFGVSLMGEFTSTAPTQAMKDATTNLVAWRFSLAGVPATGTVAVGGLNLQRISGHRDVVSTECPGAQAYPWITGAGGLRDAVAAQLAATLPAPTNMHLSTTTSSSITWAWNPTAGVARYELMASGSPAFSSPTSRLVTGTSYRWGFGSEGTFYAKVRGVDAAGKALTGWSAVAPGSPVAPPAGMRLSTTTSSSITWAWSPVAGVSKYEILASASSAFSSPTSRLVTGTSYRWGFGSEGTFHAKVRGVDAAGKALTGWSAVAPGSPVSPPSNMHVATTTDSSITWAWTGAYGVSKYEILASASSTFSSPTSRLVTGTSYRWGFGSEGTFHAKVRGVDAAGKALTGWSGVSSGSPVAYNARPAAASFAQTTLPAPANMRVPATGLTSVTWAWDPVAGVAKYELMASASSAFTSPTSRVVAGTSYTWGFGSDYLFYAKVRGLDAAGVAITGWSNVAAGSPSKGDRIASVGTSVQFTGHGYGHGIGMSQYGAKGAAALGASHSTILGTYYPGTVMGSTSGSISIRMMADDSTLAVAPQAGLVFRSLATGSARLLGTTYLGKPISQIYLRPTPGKETTSSDLMVQTSSGSSSLGSYSGDGQFEAPSLELIIGSSHKLYRTKLRSVRPTGSASRYTVNITTVENYVKGVITQEMPASWPTDALRSQAVAARTYGVYDRTSGDKYYNTCDTTSCQVYGGMSAETSTGNAAVDATAGQIRTYGGATAFTQFSSSSGGYTNRGSQPYLSPVDDSAWEAAAANPNHDWSVAVSVATIESRLGITDLKSVTINARNGYGDYGGRSVTVVFGRATGAEITKSGDEVRSMFGLKSNWFRVF